MGLQASARDGASTIGRRRRRVGVRLYYPVVDAESQPECLGIPQPPAAHSALQVQERMHHARTGGLAWVEATPGVAVRGVARAVLGPSDCSGWEVGKGKG